MRPDLNTEIAEGKHIQRDDFIGFIQTSLNAKSFKFARKLTLHWLEKYPGDLHIEMLHAQALIGDKRHDRALPILKRLSHVDPEGIQVHKLLVFANSKSRYSTQETTKASIQVLEGKDLSNNQNIPQWAKLLSNAQLEIRKSNIQKAEKFIHEALLSEPDTALPAIRHIQLAYAQYDWQSQLILSKQYHDRWPDSLIFILILADNLMNGGGEFEAVNLLHQAAAADIAGQVPSRIWGSSYPYKTMWPTDLQISIPFPIPADVNEKLGWNQLAQGTATIVNVQKPEKKFSWSNNKKKKKNKKRKSKGNKEFSFEAVQNEFQKIASKLKVPNFAQIDARFPVYVVLTTQQGLEDQYGSDQLPGLHQELEKVSTVYGKLSQWDSCLLYVDEPKSTERYGLPPAKYNDPWSIKIFIKDLEDALRKQGEMIGALLIVGGEKVVPFHHLPNPVDDIDPDVPSDNPYSTSDDNYFVSSWPVGRLPGSAGSDPAPLISQLQKVVKHQEHRQKKQPMIKRWSLLFLSRLLRRYRVRPSFGYTAEVWRRASNSVFRPIGKPHTLVISPPMIATNITKYNNQPVHLAYFNLHGLEDKSEWYGQRDPIESPAGEDYPIALRPEDIVNSGKAPQIVFSEACYGAHVINKKTEEAISLKFLDSGSMAVVGSTCTSYGSISPPLNSADLLGKIFWHQLNERYPVGEALQRAKIQLANEMIRRQGYLDGEDQKTLISFILYGDPMAVAHTHERTSKAVLRNNIDSSTVTLVCDKFDVEKQPIDKLPVEITDQVKSIVKNYLPGMKGAKVISSQEHTDCKGHNCPTHHIGAKYLPQDIPTRRVITLSKKVEADDFNHPRYARMTFDAKGKLVKLAVSR